MNCQIAIQMLGCFMFINLTSVTFHHLLSTYLSSAYYRVPSRAPGEVDTMYGFKNKVNSSCRIKQSAVIENNWGHLL